MSASLQASRLASKRYSQQDCQFADKSAGNLAGMPSRPQASQVTGMLLSQLTDCPAEVPRESAMVYCRFPRLSVA